MNLNFISLIYEHDYSKIADGREEFFDLVTNASKLIECGWKFHSHKHWNLEQGHNILSLFNLFWSIFKSRHYYSPKFRFSTSYTTSSKLTAFIFVHSSFVLISWIAPIKGWNKTKQLISCRVVNLFLIVETWKCIDISRAKILKIAINILRFNWMILIDSQTVLIIVHIFRPWPTLFSVKAGNISLHKQTVEFLLMPLFVNRFSSVLTIKLMSTNLKRRNESIDDCHRFKVFSVIDSICVFKSFT